MTVESFCKKQEEAFNSNLTDKIKNSAPFLPVITISGDPGSGGAIIAESIAQRMEYRLYAKNILTAMANKADVKEAMLEEIEKRRPSEIEDFIRSILPKDGYVYKGDYFENLKETVSNLAMIGKAVFVGRGANFIIPKEKRFALRVVAPLDNRIKNIASFYDCPLEEAENRITNRESKRKTFIKNNFREDIDDHIHYDLTLNTERMDLLTCTEIVIGAIRGSQANRVFENAGSNFMPSKAQSEG